MHNSGIYIHVPFCESKCDYCSFCSLPVKKNSGLTEKYTRQVCREIRELSQNNNISADTIYFGGGTPTVLSFNQIERIFLELHESFEISSDCEATIETNPAHITKERVRHITGLGFNRISLGIQSLNRKALTLIGRKGGFADDTCLDVFFSSNAVHSVDFISGIHPDFDTCGDIRKILLYSPEHISVYLLSVDKGTPLYDRYPQPLGYSKYQKNAFVNAADLLENEGYCQYEISNFSRGAFRSRHNSKYWNFTPYFGFGPGAHSYNGTDRFYNNCGIQKYIAGGNVREIDERDRNDIIIEFFMTSLRTVEGASEKRFYELFGEYFPEKITGIAHNSEDFIISGPSGERYISIRKRAWVYHDSLVFDLIEDYL